MKKFNSAHRILLILFVLSLAIMPQWAQAQEFCSLLDQVVDGAVEKPPFASVRYVSAPHADCAVSNYDQHERRGAKGLRFSGHEQDSWLCLWEAANLKQANDIHERIYEAWKDLDVDHPAYDQLDSQFDQSKKMLIRARNNFLSQTRNFVATIQQCNNNKIRGSWAPVDEKVKYYRRRRGFLSGYWYFCQSPGPVCMGVAAISRHFQLKLTVWNEGERH